ncbi:hypothetical protein COO91_10360 (plasmid) [Nostoc flagelliforme CCNUN1]|uniref:Uncharacterized protein n=1 Tax=Nostoc flagelliforme CCNUN1 TaxID=2038116 RepID=A0A2K8T915_9NOSO|nr:hypothetical protein COO91_10360 [Nostoc flagelliforme CCNUN1]
MGIVEELEKRWLDEVSIQLISPASGNSWFSTVRSLIFEGREELMP